MLKKRGIIMFSALFLLSACTQKPDQGQIQINKEPKNQLPQVEAKLPKIDHIVIVIEENHSRQQIKGNPSAPYMNSLMEQGANLTNYHAIEHPSQPNYLDFFSGANQGVTNDQMPWSKFSTPNLASELLKKNLTFAGYSEAMPSTGYNGVSADGGYARKHNPWVNFTNIPKSVNQPFENFPNDFKKLPTVSFVIPTLQHDMHDGTIEEADQWLKKQIDPYVKWAKQNNSLLIVTWDEDDNSHSNNVPAFFVGPMVMKGQYNENANHFNMLRTIEDIYGTGHAGESNNVNPITNIWNNNKKVLLK